VFSFDEPATGIGIGAVKYYQGHTVPAAHKILEAAFAQ
jgi:hypothetical protein